MRGMYADMERWVCISVALSRSQRVEVDGVADWASLRMTSS